MRMQPTQFSRAEFSGAGMLRRAVFLITLPGFLVKMKHHGIAGRLNYGEHTTDQGTASQQIAYRKGYSKV